MDAARALDQIAEIHRQIAKGEVYRGYRSLPVAVSGAIGVIAAWFQPAGLASTDPDGFVVYWTLVAAVAAFVGSSEIVFNYCVRENASGRRQTRRVASQFLPALAAGAAVTLCFARTDARLIRLLPGLWAMCFGVAIFACRPYLPRASGWVGLFYFTAGMLVLWIGATAPLSAWAVGGIFAAGQFFGAAVLWWNLERT